MDKGNMYKIEVDSLEEFTGIVDALLKKTDWKSSRLSSTSGSNLDTAHALMTGGVKRELSFAQTCLNTSSKGFAMTEGINKVYLTIRQALLVAAKISGLFDKASNLDTMRKESGISESRQSEFRDKGSTSAAIFAFVTAYFVVHELSTYHDDELEAIQMEFEGIPELDLTSAPLTRKCMLYYYVAYLSETGRVTDENTFIKMTLLYFQGIIDDILARKNSLKYLDIFADTSYKLEDSEFSVHGFEMNVPGHVVHVEFNRVEWGEIVGNHESKHAAQRSIAGLMCYDPVTQKNPMKELGGFFRTKLTYGPPGTGKSMEIAAVATDLGDRCKDLGIPFVFHPFPDNIISTFQGGSAERAIQWFKPILHDPGRIIYAPIDDSENNLQNRTDQGVSAGVKEVVGVFLRSMEGAYAVDHGNNLVNLYTNNEELIDKAVLSRVQGRTFMGGAETLEDFLDQDFIGIIKHFEKVLPEFVDLRQPKKYKYMSAQILSDRIAEAYAQKAETNVYKVKKALELTQKICDPRDAEFQPTLDIHMKAEFPNYTSRDKRNIHSAIKARSMDFDLPSEWMKDHGLFFSQDYDTKLNMIKDVQRDFLKGKKLSDIYLEEAVFYFDNMAKIADKVFESKVVAMIEQQKIAAEVQRRLSKA